MPGHVDLGQEDVALVAVALLSAQRDGCAPRPALVLPLVEPAGHGHDVAVAELRQGVGCERGANAAGAVDHDMSVVVGDPRLHLALQVPARDVDRPGRAPCSYSSGSRTSRTNVEGEPTSASASAVSTSRTLALASRSRSRKLAMPKCYLYGRVMELGDAIRRRSMCRSFSERPVPADAVDRLLDRARRAPSAGHAQGWSFLVLKGRAQTDRFWQADADQHWLEDPTLPGLLRADVIVRATLQRGGVHPPLFGAGQGRCRPHVAGSLVGALLDRRCGVRHNDPVAQCGRGAPRRPLLRTSRGGADRLRTAFAIPEEWSPIGAIAIGWPSEDPGPRARPSGRGVPWTRWCTGAPGEERGRPALRVRGAPGGRCLSNLVPPRQPHRRTASPRR